MSNVDDFSRAVGAIEQQAIERYSRRLAQFGEDPRTLGWDTRAHQWTRFAATTAVVDFHAREVLDIGCGLGDFRVFLEDRGIAPSSYAGVDINDDLLAIGRRRFPDSRFERRNVVLDPYTSPVCDVAVMLGLVNFRLEDLDNYDYAARAIDAAFAGCREALVVDMLSARRTPEYPEEDFVFYFEPARMLDVALARTPYVQLHHAYPGLPQREFMLVLRKTPA
ncbi:MAG: methyltransferase domain-containing protein [Acidobacteriota bacterium]